ncbi:MAG: NYN domain-containing protein [Dermatophilaceae bacterium]
MRSYCAIYVDVGYLLAAAATRVTGTSLRRGVQVDHPELIRGLIEHAESDSGLPLLRVNWYDSGARPGGMPDFIQDEIGLLPRVKLRLGRLSHAGEQKGVDLRIGLDLATHGRNRVVDVIYLVSGDDDLTEAVEEAQGHGVQVILLAVPGQDDRPHGVARHLQRAADGLILLDGETIDQAVRSRAIPEALVPDELKPAQDDEAPAADTVPEPVGVNGSGPMSPTSPAPPLATSSAEETDGAPTDDDQPRTEPSEEPSEGPSEDPSGTDEPAPAQVTADEPSSTTETAAVPGPTPSLFAKRKATTLLPPPEPVWSTTTGSGGSGTYPDTAVDPEVIDTVARQVIRSWCTTATPTMLAELKEQRPSIPGDLDRAMLVDLSNRSGHYDVDENSRHELRNRFWQLVDQVRLTA